jgi:hypothetical protein
MIMRRFCWTVAAVGALVWAGCAPTGSPPTGPTAGPQERADEAPDGAPAGAVTAAPALLGRTVEERVRAAVLNVRGRQLLTTNGFWTVFHGILGLGPATVTLADPQTGRTVNAVDYLRGGGELRGLQFTLTPHGLDVLSGQLGISQGHQDQFIAEMAQWGMPIDTAFRVQGREFTFRDFVNHAKMRARVTSNQELSWAILVIAQYLGTNLAWTNADGERLTFEDLVKYELDAPVETAPCGGTHRLFGLSWAYHLHVSRGGADEGVWRAVADKTAAYRDRAKRLQNPDGTFSTEYFRGPGRAADAQLRLASSGHIFEWLALALSDEELKAGWVEDAANAVALLILDQQGRPVEGGALYHAVHGLLIYHARRHGFAGLDFPPPLIPPPPRQRPLTLPPPQPK